MDNNEIGKHKAETQFLKDSFEPKIDNLWNLMTSQLMIKHKTMVFLELSLYEHTHGMIWKVLWLFSGAIFLTNTLNQV